MKTLIPVQGLMVLLATLVLAIACFASAPESPLLLVLQQQGGGRAVHFTTFRLSEDGTLELIRRSPGGQLLAKGRVQIDADTLARYRTLLEEGGYFSESTPPAISEVTPRGEDQVVWRLDVFRDGNKVASTVFPRRALVERLRPTATEIPYLQVAWTLIEEFKAKWSEAEFEEIEP